MGDKMRHFASKLFFVIFGVTDCILLGKSGNIRSHQYNVKQRRGHHEKSTHGLGWGGLRLAQIQSSLNRFLAGNKELRLRGATIR